MFQFLRKPLSRYLSASCLAALAYTGVIGLQSETAEIYYRNIEIKEFDEVVPMEKFLKK
jgi:hypothetical protein